MTSTIKVNNIQNQCGGKQSLTENSGYNYDLVALSGDSYCYSSI